jgi:hypothetical protein
MGAMAVALGTALPLGAAERVTMTVRTVGL